MPGPSSSAAPRDDRRLAWRVSAGIGLSVAATNLVGVVAVFAFAVWVLPSEPIADEDHAVSVNLVLASIWAPLAVLLGAIWGNRKMRPARAWLLEGRAPTADEEVAVLRSPLRLFRVQIRLWLLSAVVFATVNGLLTPRLITRVGFPIILGGLTTCALTYLTTERMLRPLAARALAEGALDRPRLPGVTARQLLTWALGTGVPILGLVITGIFGAAESDTSRLALAVTMITLGSTAFGVGLWATFLGAKAVADPVRSVRQGLERVVQGDLDVEIPVYDGSEVGLLQDGFNRMVEGLRERERIRDVFGRHVGAVVAAEAIDNSALGGEEHEVAVLFVDIVASTRLAADNPPDVVVDVLNRFFAVVVATVDDHGGWINKFQGDAALAVFGAPGPCDDPAGCALAAGRDLAGRLATEVPDCRAGIGIAHGPVVAGNIGAEQRFEYTVIGDPVNEAARLTELAKDVPGGLLASGSAVDAAAPAEAACWEPVDSVVLRGRTAPTVLHHPRSGEVPGR
ncbi:MAG TPA: adenylate/guanylate cyclase domain-containing protein [Iamia sp.]|nr:adenylate/guanylate cyclase domain-containing protein [Iamia sp.]